MFRIVQLDLCGHKFDHITPLLKDLNWLPIDRRIIFKIVFLTFKAVNNLAPNCVCELLHRYTPGRSMRSSSLNLLLIPPSKLKSYGDRAFSVCAPKLWNSLPKQIKEATSVYAFKKIVLKHIFLKDIFVLIDSLSFLPDSTVLNFTFKFLLCIDCKVP